MAEDRYPTPYREGGYQDGLKRAIMRRVSGPQAPTGAPMHVSGPLMGGGRLLRTPERRGFPLTRPPRPLPIETRQPFPRPLKPWPFGREEAPGVFGEEGYPGERVGRTERMRAAWLEQLASRLPGLAGARAPIAEAPLADPWQAWLDSIQSAGGGIGRVPQIPAAPGAMTPEMLAEMLRRLFGGGIGI